MGHLDTPVFMTMPKSLLIDIGIQHRMESCMEISYCTVLLEALKGTWPFKKAHH